MHLMPPKGMGRKLKGQERERVGNGKKDPRGGGGLRMDGMGRWDVRLT